MKSAIILVSILLIGVSVNAFPKDRPPVKCVKGGCSGELCVEEGDDVLSTCEWRNEFECYREATCKEQFFGRCGWVMDQKLRECIREKRSQTHPIDGEIPHGNYKSGKEESEIGQP
jgi:eight-cysteine-cluster-containing protein